MALAKCNVPWDVIMELDDTERRGMCIAAGIVDGQEFDWRARTWKNRNA